MAKYNTGNALGSADPRDLFDNSENLDGAVNSELDTWVDRFGKTRRTMAGIDHDSNRAMLAYGYVTKKSFTLGNTLSNPNEVLFNEGDGEYYRWDGALPKVVPASSTPETAGGIGSGEWVSVGDAALRQELAAGEGSMIGLSGGRTLQNFVDGIFNYIGITPPDYKAWSAGSTSKYEDVWLWTDGSLWTSYYGTLPAEPTALTMQRYSLLNDTNTISNFIAQIAVSDKADSTTGALNLKEELAIALLGKSQVITDGGVSGRGTLEDPINIGDTLNSLGMGTWPDFSLSGAVVPNTLTADEAGSDGYPSTVNTWAFSNSTDLGLGYDGVKSLVFTGVVQKGRLFRFLIDMNGSIYTRGMASDWSWGSSSWNYFYNTSNTTVASDGALHAASPIVRVVESVSATERPDLLSLNFSQAGECGAANPEANGVTVTKESTGVYVIKGCSGLYPDGWQVKDAYPVQGSTPVALGRAETQSDGSVKVSVYARKMTLNSETMEITQTLGDPMDVPATSWIDVRVAMPTTASTSTSDKTSG